MKQPCANARVYLTLLDAYAIVYVGKECYKFHANTENPRDAALGFSLC